MSELAIHRLLKRLFQRRAARPGETKNAFRLGGVIRLDRLTHDLEYLPGGNPKPPPAPPPEEPSKSPVPLPANWPAWESYGRKLQKVLAELNLQESYVKTVQRTAKGLLLTIEASMPFLLPPYLVKDPEAEALKKTPEEPAPPEKPSAPPGLKTAYESWVEAGKPPAPAGLKTATEELEPPTDERHTKA